MNAQPTACAVLEITCQTPWAEAIGDALVGLGAGGVEHDELSTDHVLLKAYFTHPADPANEARLRAAVQELLDGWPRDHFAGDAAPRWSQPDPVDWAAECRKSQTPIALAPDLWIYPDDDPEAPQDAVRLIAGQAFGTGRHPTTRLCALALRKVMESFPAAMALDVGTGSGILAILAARWCAARVVAIDDDPEVFENARANVRANRMETRIDLLPCSAEEAPGPFDVVAANLTAPVLMELAPTLAGRVEPGGRLILGGILEEERDATLAAFEKQKMRLVAENGDEGWRSLTLAKDRTEGPHGVGDRH